jgi:DNA polymerase
MAMSAAPFVPAVPDWETVREAALGCRGCDLWQRATQTVFGEGDLRSELMLVGEQPGDKEDLAGQPFVGPAGKLLDDALVDAGIDRGAVYVTNVVKHFKWRVQGKRRLHEKPNSLEISACRPWLEKEIEIVRPHGIVLLGASAAQALLGREFKVTKSRGEVVRREGFPPLAATVHPSSILRSPDDVSRRHAFEAFVADLRSIRSALAAS